MKDKPHSRRINAEKLRFQILTELPKYESFKYLDMMVKDDIIQFIITQIDKVTEGTGDLYQ
jgi:hypothetical protein